jgi:hypothetical protein
VTVLIDVTKVPEACCTDHLELMAKATAEGPGTPEGMFRPLENPWARAIVEASTARFQGILRQIEEALARFLGGSADELRKATVPWLRWDEARFEVVRARLESLDPHMMTIADYELLIEYLVQRYLPPGVIEEEADFIAVRAALMGKIQANLQNDRRVNDPLVDTLAALMPTRFAAIEPHVLTPRELAMLEYGRAHAAENIRHVTEQARHRMAQIVLEHVQGGILGQREGTWAYAKQRLFDEFATLNRDFRRISVTETGEIVNQGLVASQEPGARLRRVEAYRGACDFCKSINGRVVTVVSPDKPNKDGDREIWAGKTNIGRSASPMKREGNTLVEREPHEMWWIAAGVMHPHCRGAWSPVTNRPPEVSAQFFNFLQAKLDAAHKAAVG